MRFGTGERMNARDNSVLQERHSLESDRRTVVVEIQIQRLLPVWKPDVANRHSRSNRVSRFRERDGRDFADSKLNEPDCFEVDQRSWKPIAIGAKLVLFLHQHFDYVTGRHHEPASVNDETGPEYCGQAIVNGTAPYDPTASERNNGRRERGIGGLKRQRISSGRRSILLRNALSKLGNGSDAASGSDSKGGA
jgi:hypothetical protein